jgi:hypothetical protein
VVISIDPLHVILDLDETLIHSRDEPFDKVVHDFVIDPHDCHFFCYIRPGAREFIHKLMNDDRFRVGVYTAATAGYASTVIDNLWLSDRDKLTAVLARDRTTPRQGLAIGMDAWEFAMEDQYQIHQEKTLRKYLKASGAKRSRTIALDDSPKAWRKSYGNLLSIPAFEKPESNDFVLRGSYKILEALSKKKDVRPTEKRGAISSFVKNLESSKSCSLEF